MRTPKPALQEQLPSASPFVPACLPPRQCAHSCVHAQEVPGASPCTLARVPPSYLHRNVGILAARIQPDAQHSAEESTRSSVTPAADRWESTALGTGARYWAKERVRVPFLIYIIRTQCFPWCDLSGSQQ